MEVAFENFNIHILDLLEMNHQNGKMYLTDAEVKAEDFDEFLKFYKEHRSKGAYFNTIINNKGFYGRFGQMLYSSSSDKYILRLAFVESSIDSTERTRDFTDMVVTDRLEYRNLKAKIVKQEIIIEKLKMALVSKGVFTLEEIAEVTAISEDEEVDGSIRLRSESTNLQKYLVDIHDTLDDIKREELNN